MLGCSRTGLTHKHDASVTVATQVVDVEEADLATLAAVHALNVLDLATDLGLALGSGSLDLLDRRTRKPSERRARLVDGDPVPFQAVDKRRAENAGGNVAALVAGLVGACALDTAWCREKNRAGKCSQRPIVV